jgi:uncharacterized protein YaiE (UPF0345 family)
MRITSLLSVVGLVAVAGCAPQAEPVGAQPVGAAQAEPVGNQISASATESAKKYSAQGPAFGGESCTETYNGDPTDVDGDTIRDNLNSVTATCTGGGGTANASFSIKDDLVEQVNPALFPWNLTITGHFDVEGTDGVATVTSSADRTTSVHSNASSFGGSDEASVDAEISTANASFSAAESYNWDSTYTQTEAAPFGDGLMSLEGGWSVEADYQEGENEARIYADATVSADAPGLALDDACESHIVGGILRATYDAGAAENDESATVTATLTVTFTGCDAWSTTYSETVNPAGGS